MKLRYQLRGLGIGMVVTALLMGVTAGDGTSISDAEIRARALELGMIEGDSLKLTDIVPTQTPPSNSGKPSSQDVSTNPSGASSQGTSANPGGASVQGSSEEPGTEATKGTSANLGGASVQGSSGEPGMGEAQGTSANPGGTSVQGSSANSGGVPVKVPSNGGSASSMPNTVSIVIEQGEIASEICVKLAEAGAIEDALAFETYLCENNWTRSIIDGIYNIPLGISMEEVAKIIMQTP